MHNSPSTSRTGGRLIGRARALGLLVASCAAVLAAAPPAPAASGGTSVVQRALDRLVEHDGFPGAVATVRGRDGRVRELTAGVANLRTRRPMPADGRVRIGSNTKTFTATVVLQLVGEGRVALDGSIEQVLPGVVRGKGIDAGRITVRQLLQHTSGLADYDEMFADYLPLRHRYFPPAELLAEGLSKKPLFAPGAGWSYSNTNYLLLGMLIERVTGNPVGTEITRRIIEPLGLDGTSWPAAGDDAIRGRHAHGYYRTKRSERWTDVTESDASVGWAAGALISTPRDTNRFFGALLAGRLLPPALLDAMLTTVRASDATAHGPGRYGLGIQSLALECGGVAWGHGGDIFGYETRNAVTADGRQAFVAVTALPTSLRTARHVEDVVEDALCRA